MISSQAVSVELLVIWLMFFVVRKVSTNSSCIIYFTLLLAMSIAGLVLNPMPLLGLQPCEYDPVNIFIFAILMLLMILPWFTFDSYIDCNPYITINECHIVLLQKVFLITIVLSAYAIVYAMPYAVFAYSLGAETIRNMIMDKVIMPNNVFTTMAVGISTFSPVIILFFFISLLDDRLKKYRVLLVLSSLSYIVTSMTQAARDGFIFTTLTYAVLFVVFKNSIRRDLYFSIRKIGVLVFGALIVVFLTMTISRFGSFTEENKNEFLYGTWGYLYQQPYVFDHVISQFHSFYGFNRRLHFLGNFINISGYQYTGLNQVEFMFGTQLAEFYEITGFQSLVIGVIVYISLFKYVIGFHMKRENYFSLLLSFVIYIYFTLSGLFYFRFGGNDSEFFFYMGLLLISFFLPNFVTINQSKL